MILHETELDEIARFLSDSHQHEGIKLVLIEGNEGVGKTTLIDQALRSIPRGVVYARAVKGTAMALEPMMEILTLDPRYNELPFYERVKREWIETLKNPDCHAVYFGDIKYFSNESKALLYDLLDYLYRRYQDISIACIVEYSDDFVTSDNLDFIAKLNEFATRNPIRIMRLDEKRSAGFVIHSLEKRGYFDCSYDACQQIARRGFNNPKHIQRLVEYLSGKGLIHNSDDGVCEIVGINDVFDQGLFKEHIEARFERLDPLLKDVLKKASIVGFRIDMNLLETPLQIYEAETALNRIEKLSRLVQKTHDKFEFESVDVHNYILNSDAAWDELELNRVLAQYLSKRSLVAISQHNYEKAAQYLYRSACYFEKAEDSNDAIRSWHSFSDICIQIRYLHGAIEGLKRTLLLLPFEDSDARLFLILVLVECCIEAAEYNEAICFLESMPEKPNSCENKLYYLSSCCYYQTGRTIEARSYINALTDNFTFLNAKEQKNSYYQVKGEKYLLGMLLNEGKKPLAQRKFEGLLRLLRDDRTMAFEYNDLLTRSSMFFDPSISHIHIEKSLPYFKKHCAPYHRAKALNNLGADLTAIGDLSKASKKLKKSVSIFEELCSLNSHYPKNNIGVLYAMRGDISTAMDVFAEARTLSDDPFSNIWIGSNITHGFRLQGNLSKCASLIAELEKRYDSLEEKEWYLRRNIDMAWGWYWLDSGDRNSAYKYFSKAFHTEVEILNNDTYDVYLSKIIIELSREIAVPAPKKAQKLASVKLSLLLETAIMQHAQWSQLYFWED